MAQRDQYLPKWLLKAVKAGAISEPHAYLLLWYQDQEMEWIPLPDSLYEETEAIYLLELPAVGPIQ